MLLQDFNALKSSHNKWIYTKQQQMISPAQILFKCSLFNSHHGLGWVIKGLQGETTAIAIAAFVQVAHPS